MVVAPRDGAGSVRKSEIVSIAASGPAAERNGGGGTIAVNAAGSSVEAGVGSRPTDRNVPKSETTTARATAARAPIGRVTTARDPKRGMGRIGPVAGRASGDATPCRDFSD